MTTKLLEYVQSVRPAVRIAEPLVIPPPNGHTWTIDDLDALVDDFVAVIISLIALIFLLRNSLLLSSFFFLAILQFLYVLVEEAALVQY